MSRVRFLQEKEVPETPGDLVFREGLRRNAVALGLCLMLATICLLGPTLAPRFGWDPNGLESFAYGFGTVLGLLSLLPLRVVRMALAPTNWVLRLAPNGLYLRYRSFLNGDYPGEPVAAFLPMTTIAGIRPIVEQVTRIDSDGGSQRVTLRLLEITLREPDLTAFREQLSRERERRIPTRFGSKAVFRHYPVQVVGDDCLRIIWRDIQTATTPRLAEAAALLARRFPSHPEAQRTRPEAETLDRTGQENEILDLLETGELLQAIKLTKRLYGLSTTDARAFVMDLSR